MNKIKMLEIHTLGNWFGIDEILFENSSPREVLDEDSYKSYMTTKAALLSNLFELYLKLEYFTDAEFKKEEELREFYVNYAKVIKEKALEEMSDPEVINSLKEDVSNYVKLEGKNESDYTDIILEKTHRIFSLDHLLITEAVVGGCGSCLKDFEGRVLIGSYRTLRDKLIEMVN